MNGYSNVTERFTHPSKTYATRENALKAVNKLIADRDEYTEKGFTHYHVIVSITEGGRFFPVVMLGNDYIDATFFAINGFSVV